MTTNACEGKVLKRLTLAMDVTTVGHEAKWTLREGGVVVIVDGKQNGSPQIGVTALTATTTRA